MGGLLLSVTQSLTVSKSRGVKGWLGTCWELSFILPVAPEGVCGLAEGFHSDVKALLPMVGFLVDVSIN